MTDQSLLILTGEDLTIEDVQRVSQGQFKQFELSALAVKRVNASRKLVEQWVANGETIYGVTTGFGEFANVSIPQDDLRALQQNLVRSHSAGVGEPLTAECVRAMLVLRANALAKGCSGIRASTIRHLLALLTADALPYIPPRGSVGSSGDLAPLSHLALAMTGEGYISLPEDASHSHDAQETQHLYTLPGRVVVPARTALKLCSIPPLVLEAKEGLALINGTQMMSALGCLALYRATHLAELADIAASMSFEALRATDKAFDARLHLARPHEGQRIVAEHMRHLTRDSEIRMSHTVGDGLVQDAYSMRCIPQVHGAVRDTIAFAECVLKTEINSATDNPLIIPDDIDAIGAMTGVHLEGGNFHGEPLAFVLDYLAIALSELANISERRTERMVNGALSNHLPRFLTPKENAGLHSGMMIAQYTAAALVSENKILSHPASVDSIPTSANQEDHNSMGSIAAHKLMKVVENVGTVLAIECMAAAQGIDFLAPLKPGKGSGQAYDAIRTVVPFLDTDRMISEDIARMQRLTGAEQFVAIVNAA